MRTGELNAMRKSPVNGKPFTSVTFEVPAELGAQRACVVGDFNDWSESATQLKPRKDGSHAATLRLPNGRPYRFRYLIDDEVWENDWSADGYVPNPFGTEDSVVQL
jgi:1,4-alpha-glucan branching enzyme